MCVRLAVILAFMVLLNSAARATEPPYDCAKDEFGQCDKDSTQYDDDDETADDNNACLRAKVCFGLGPRSWADSILSFEPGSPLRCGAIERKERAIGKKDGSAAWLGSGGSIAVGFDDNELNDFAGPDLWIYEKGKNKEPVSVAVLGDAEKWVPFGKTSGGRTAVDLATNPRTRGRRFKAVRLIDVQTKRPDETCVPQTRREHPGADIDAVGAQICAIQFEPGDLALFAVDQATLTATAKAQLMPVADLLRETESVIVDVKGFADADGSSDYNMKLSQRRAIAVRDFLLSEVDGLAKMRGIEISASGKGEIGDETDEPDEKQLNRRVEIEVLPDSDKKCEAAIR